jgi:hypothetical protein
MGWGRNKHQARHAYVHPEDGTAGPAHVPTVEPSTARVFTVRGEMIAPGHPLYKWLLEFEYDFRRHWLELLKARKARLQQFIQRLYNDVAMLDSGSVSPAQLASIMIDRARIANRMRPRARVVPRISIPAGSQLVRSAA